MSTVRLHVEDLAAAKRWYADLLGVEPYFDRPGYAEFRIGDYQHELGLLEARFASHLGKHEAGRTGPAGVVAYWHVEDVPASLQRLLSLGAREHEAPRDFGHGFVGASVVDPFGNVLGIMSNPHYREVLGARARVST